VRVGTSHCQVKDQHSIFLILNQKPAEAAKIQSKKRPSRRVTHSRINHQSFNDPTIDRFSIFFSGSQMYGQTGRISLQSRTGCTGKAATTTGGTAAATASRKAGSTTVGRVGVGLAGGIERRGGLAEGPGGVHEGRGGDGGFRRNFSGRAGDATVITHPSEVHFVNIY
jgi:hypothetical protein